VELVKHHHPLQGKATTAVNHESHQGKVMEIYRMSYSLGPYNRGFNATGAVLKKDGKITKPTKVGQWFECRDIPRIKALRGDVDLPLDQIEDLL